ncbi:MAG: hypothetical protein D6713_03620 [Deltaproteobacteria bacterium]|nr:MAG: hypothetical protein D6713_03620 [Deltaproteobacteria bacterium]
MSPYSQEVLKYLNLGIESELQAYVFYKKVMEKINDEETLEAVRKLAEDEKHHFLQLEDEYDKSVRSEMWAPYRDIMRKEGLPDIDEHISETHKELLARVDKLKTKREIFEVALELEKEAYELFAGFYEKTDDEEAKKLFQFLMNFEKGHVLTVENMLKNL